MNLSLNATLDDFNKLKSIITQKHSSLDPNNIKAFFLKKLPEADVLIQNKNPGSTNNTTHIACTTGSRHFFYEAYANAIVKNCNSNLTQNIPVFVEAKCSNSNFVKSECAIWTIPKDDKNQIGLSKTEKDGVDFKNLRLKMEIDDVLIFFKYASSSKDIDIYTILLKKDKDKQLISLLPKSSTSSKIKSPSYYEDMNNNEVFIEAPLNENSNIQISNIMAINKMFLGAPGTGKSKFVDDTYFKNKHAKRITFHSEYTYHDFVGSIKPILDENNNIKYDFFPGVFTEILLESLQNPTIEYNLIIEELNRANASAVFGDLLQLLDRDETGKSEYPVTNIDIIGHMKKKYNPSYSAVIIPNNLNIIATMNSADQNVFALDTAFKRRWEVEYVPIKFENSHKFKDKLISKLDITWKDFVTTINEFMMGNENSDLMISEDKQLGPYFIKETELDDAKKFVYKVFLYLWDDVFKMDRSRLFNVEIRTFSQVIENFESNNPFKIFSNQVEILLKKINTNKSSSTQQLTDTEE